MPGGPSSHVPQLQALGDRALAQVSDADLQTRVTIRTEPFLAYEAITRLTNHAAYHVGQIVLLAKHFSGPEWKSLSIPKGQSKLATKGTYQQGIIPTVEK